MNTGAKPPSGSDPAASRKPTAVKSPLSASASACLLSEGGKIAGSGNSNGNGIGTTVHASDRKSQNLAGSSSVSSISTPGTESRPEPAIPRIVYGRGKILCLPTELARLCVSAPLIVSSPSRIPLARRIQAIIPNPNSRILDSAVVNVPAHVVDDAVSRIDDRDVVISVGGASAVGLAGAIGCRKNIPHICVPTTYSGSEMMPLLLDACPARHSTTTQSTGQNISHSSSHSGSRSEKPHRRHREMGSLSRSSRKGSRTTSFRDPRVLPSVIIYDEDLTTSIPRRLSAPSNETAMARSAEIREQDGTSQWSYIQLPGV
ncbi:hypothetical protein E4U31_001661 [Claviceps sp. LM219 group G6]|nr:hypothetical protein E4U31_001661 [Claviceps sp. LM219 group G6]